MKCLLIYPNPESALNEEAGKLLLEQYDEYSKHARMMTDIHAKPSRASSTRSDLSVTTKEGDETETKKPTIDKSSGASGTTSVVEKKKKEKKKALKRL